MKDIKTPDISIQKCYSLEDVLIRHENDMKYEII